ncbi:MAG: hypothetical protein E6J55_25965 [Deltaproteobacteria bacterium]|nr:MAG: hypothetical protein E6J55_25965 [Deltaproteobacteria bacterium]
MRHDEFRIALEFWCGGRRWRCTDVGSRVVVAVCLEPHEVVTVTCSGAAMQRTTTPVMTGDASWLEGPPYALAEEVFDEHAMEGCTLSRV